MFQTNLQKSGKQILKKLPSLIRPFFIYVYRGAIMYYIQSLSRTNNCDWIILDAGCGDGYLFTDIDEDNSNFIKVGIDLFPPYLRHCKLNNCYDDYILCDIALMPFNRKVFDVILCTEVIEHLPKRVGTVVLDRFDDLAKQIILLTSPVETPPQHEINGNCWQRHLSAWTPSELEKFGYVVRGSSGVRFSHSLGFLSLFFTLLSEVIGFYKPNYAVSMICIKRK